MIQDVAGIKLIYTSTNSKSAEYTEKQKYKLTGEVLQPPVLLSQYIVMLKLHMRWQGRESWHVRSLQTQTFCPRVLFGVCQPITVVKVVLCCAFCALRYSFHPSESFENWKGLYWDPWCKTLQTKTEMCLPPPTPHLLRKIGSLYLQRDPLTPPKRDGQVAWKVKLPQGMNAKEFPCTKNIFNKPLSCQECFVVCWPKGEKYVNNVGYCHTKYGNIVTSELWCASGNA